MDDRRMKTNPLQNISYTPDQILAGISHGI